MGLSEPAAGRVLAGRYKLTARLGAGGFGTIWRAHDLVLDAPVALKLIDPQIAKDEGARERFIREARAAAALRSPHVVQMLDHGVDVEQPFIAMELLEGETLAERLRRVGRLSAGETLRISIHIARAMMRAHEAGIVHRDLKPENVFLINNDDEEIAKVLDFGVAKVSATDLKASQGTQTRTGSLLGTPYYMSPEQAQGNKQVDFRSDLWSLGVIVFETITGCRPFYSEGLGDLVLQICVREMPVPSEFAPVPAGFDDWFARAMQRVPEERFESAKLMVEALRRSLDADARETMVTVPEIDDEESPALARARGAQPVALARTVVDARVKGDAEDDEELEPGWQEVVEAPDGAKTAAVNPRRAGGDALTIGQFGTTRHTPPALPERRRTPVLLVGGLAVAVGALVAFFIFSGEKEATTPAAPPVSAPSMPASAGGPPDEAPLSAPPLDEHGDAAPESQTEGELGDAASAEARRMEKEAKASDSGVPSSWLPRQVDGGWQKPDWARPDEPPPAPPPTAQPSDNSDNPYQ